MPNIWSKGGKEIALEESKKNREKIYINQLLLSFVPLQRIMPVFYIELITARKAADKAAVIRKSLQPKEHKGV